MQQGGVEFFFKAISSITEVNLHDLTLHIYNWDSQQDHWKSLHQLQENEREENCDRQMGTKLSSST